MRLSTQLGPTISISICAFNALKLLRTLVKKTGHDCCIHLCVQLAEGGMAGPIDELNSSSEVNVRLFTYLSRYLEYYKSYMLETLQFYA